MPASTTDVNAGSALTDDEMSPRPAVKEMSPWPAATAGAAERDDGAGCWPAGRVLCARRMRCTRAARSSRSARFFGACSGEVMMIGASWPSPGPVLAVCAYADWARRTTKDALPENMPQIILRTPDPANSCYNPHETAPRRPNPADDSTIPV